MKAAPRELPTPPARKVTDLPDGLLPDGSLVRSGRVYDKFEGVRIQTMELEHGKGVGRMLAMDGVKALDDLLGLDWVSAVVRKVRKS